MSEMVTIPREVVERALYALDLSVEPKEQERPAPKARPQRDDVDSEVPF